AMYTICSSFAICSFYNYGLYYGKDTRVLETDPPAGIRQLFGAQRHRSATAPTDEFRQYYCREAYLPNSFSVAVINPTVGLAVQYWPSFLAFSTNFSVSMIGGSFSSL